MASAKCLKNPKVFFRKRAPPLSLNRTTAFSSLYSYRLYASSVGNGEPSDLKPEVREIPHLQLEEITQFIVPLPPECVINKTSKYRTTRDLRMCSMKLRELYKFHQCITSSRNVDAWISCTNNW
ncbi:hypothetical protein ACE6H2_027610 [Prunus campanulata]